VRVCITGGRDHTPTTAELTAFDALWAQLGAHTLVHGACRWKPNRVWTVGGVDLALARHTAAAYPSAIIDPYPVDHSIDGPWPGAGPRRNARMLRDGKPDVLIAFTGGKGTANCISQATKLGIAIYYAYASTQEHHGNGTTAHAHAGHHG
jgi:hypothetical protein